MADDVTNEELEQIKADAVDPERVRVVCPPEVRVHAGPKLLKQSVNLLVDNAMKCGGNAELRASPGEIAVRDHGPGVPTELGNRVFERFVRGNSSIPGMGLGLPLVRSLCTAMDAPSTSSRHPAAAPASAYGSVSCEGLLMKTAS